MGEAEAGRRRRSALGGTRQSAPTGDHALFPSNALHAFSPGRPTHLHDYQAGHVEYRAMVDAFPQMPGFGCLDARLLRAILGDLRSANPSPEFRKFPPEVIARAEAIRPTSAGEIRKVVKHVIGERFGNGSRVRAAP